MEMRKEVNGSRRLLQIYDCMRDVVAALAARQSSKSYFYAIISSRIVRVIIIKSARHRQHLSRA